MAKKKPLDLKGYYRALKVSPEAPPDEVRLSYALVRQGAAGPYLKKIDEAFETLRDPARRAAYDQQGHRKAGKPNKTAILAGALSLLVLVLAVVYGPGFLRGLKSFREGQTLVEIRTGREFGVVVRYDGSHAFPQGSTLPAYLVRLAASGDERWFPAYDMQAACKGR